MQLDFRQDLERQFTAEYGERAEVLVRLVGVCIGAVLLFVYTGWAVAVFWPVGFLLAHGLYYDFLKRRMQGASRRDGIVAGVLFLLVHVSFIWVPALMATSTDLALIFAGVVLSAATFPFVLRRADSMTWLLWGQALVFSGVMVTVLAAHWSLLDDPVAQFACVGGIIVMTAYAAQALFAARRLRLKAESAARQALQEQKMAAIGQLAGGVAHDFNNVLAAVIGNLELYGLLDDPQEKDEAVNTAAMVAKRAETAVSHLLIYARKAPVKRRHLRLNVAVQEIMELAKQGIPARIAWSLTAPHLDIEIKVDEAQLTTAVINLVRNAVDAISGAGQITIRAQMQSYAAPVQTADGSMLAPGQYAVLTVADTGHGIAPRDLRHVLEPFFTTKPAGRGTGLGLSMVAGFARDGGGGVLIRSAPSGTDVSIVLPGRLADTATAQTQAPQVPKTKNAAPKGAAQNA